MKNGTKFLAVFASCIALAGCGAPNATSTSGSKSANSAAKINSPAAAVRALSTSGINVSFETGEPGNLTDSGFTSQFMNMTSASQYAEIPMRFRTSLGNSPAADYIRANGTPVFVYATTQLKLATVDNEPGAKSREYTKGVRFEKSTCDGYRFVLYPGNNYSIAMAAEQRVEIRSKNRSNISAGIFSVSSSNDWKVTGARPVTTVSAVRLEPFMILNYGARYKNPINFGPAHVVSRAISTDCTYQAHRDFFKGEGNGPVQSAPGAP